MKLALMVPMMILGIVLLATPALPLGLILMWAAWWIYERSRLSDSDALITVLIVLGGLGAGAVIAQYAWQRITALL